MKLPKMSASERAKWELIVREVKKHKANYIDTSALIPKIEAELGIKCPDFVVKMLSE